jgi:hypothetical protein
MAMAIPFWQWPLVAQYIQMGLVSLIMMVKTFIMLFSGGMGPELMPVTLDIILLMGSQGLSKVDWVTVWFCGLEG